MAIWNLGDLVVACKSEEYPRGAAHYAWNEATPEQFDAAEQLVRSDEDKAAIRRAKNERFPPGPPTTWFAVGDIAAHDGFVTSRVATDVWTGQNPSGWTHQDVTGAHGTILHEGTEDECRAKLDTWLQCSDDRCYSHGTHD